MKIPQIHFISVPGDNRSKHFARRYEALEMLRKGFTPRKIRRKMKMSGRQMDKLLRRVFVYTDHDLPSPAYYAREMWFREKMLAETYTEPTK